MNLSDFGIPESCFNGLGVPEREILTASHKHPFSRQTCGADGINLLRC
jgi:hypothetical protein